MSFWENMRDFYSPEVLDLGPPPLTSRECGYLVSFIKPNGEMEHQCNQPKFIPCERSSCPANATRKHRREEDVMDLKINRGEIYYVAIPYATGHEMEKDRPAIVVSCNELNRTSTCVTVVMCSASNKRDLPEHVLIRSTPTQSVALCEHIYTVDKSRIGKRLGACSKNEMTKVDIGIAAGLGLGAYDLARQQGQKETEWGVSDLSRSFSQT